MLRQSIKTPVTGLSNQLFLIINSVLIAQRSNVKNIMFGPFNPCILSQREMNLADIVDLDDLSSKTGINIFSCTQNKQQTIVQYGIEHNYKDITDQVLAKCVIDPNSNYVELPKCDVLRAAIFGDHIPYVVKHILINGVKLVDKFILPESWNKIEYGVEGNYKDVTQIVRDAGLKEMTASDFQNTLMFGDHIYGTVKHIKVDNVVHNNYHKFNMTLFQDVSLFQYPPLWYDQVDNIGFNLICKQLKFKQIFYDIAVAALAGIGLNPEDYFNVVHLRIEKDGITHWANQNKMNVVEYRAKLVQKFRYYLTNIPDGETLVVLTNDVEDAFVRELEMRYRVIKFDHSTALINAFGFTGRELSAAVELIIGSWCKGVFVGCHNFVQKRGSSFSYLLSVLMNNKSSFYIDLDQINAVFSN